MATGRRRAAIGRLQFDEEFSNPVVDVSHEFRTVDHEIIRSEARESGFAVQVLGRKPARIEVEGYVDEAHTHSIERQINYEKPTRVLSEVYAGATKIGSDDIRAPVYFNSERWNGTVVPETIDIAKQREEYEGNKLLEVSMELREVAENVITDDAITPYDSKARNQQTLGYGSLSRSRTDTTVSAPLVREKGQIPDALYGTSESTDGIDEFGNSQTYVGRLKFAKKYADPLVDISIKHNFKENNLLGSQLKDRKEFEATSTGIEPPTITINGVILGQQTRDADLLGRVGLVLVSTEEWSGTAAVESVETVDRREVDPAFNDWIHDVTITLKGVVQDEVLLPATAPTGEIITEPTTEPIDFDEGQGNEEGPTDSEKNPWLDSTYNGRRRFHYEFVDPSDIGRQSPFKQNSNAETRWKRGEASLSEIEDETISGVDDLEAWLTVKDKYKSGSEN